MACGLGMLRPHGATQPSLAVCGDSTFFHAAIPALINGLHHGSDFLMIVLDNSATAMTGFQPHPGSDVDASGRTAVAVRIEELCSHRTNWWTLGLFHHGLDPVGRYDLRVVVQEEEVRPPASRHSGVVQPGVVERNV